MLASDRFTPSTRKCNNGIIRVKYTKDGSHTDFTTFSNSIVDRSVAIETRLHALKETAIATSINYIYLRLIEEAWNSAEACALRDCVGIQGVTLMEEFGDRLALFDLLLDISSNEDVKLANKVLRLIESNIPSEIIANLLKATMNQMFIQVLDCLHEGDTEKCSSFVLFSREEYNNFRILKDIPIPRKYRDVKEFKKLIQEAAFEQDRVMLKAKQRDAQLILKILNT